jgi:hypothetical protein
LVTCATGIDRSADHPSINQSINQMRPFVSLIRVSKLMMMMVMMMMMMMMMVVIHGLANSIGLHS